EASGFSVSSARTGDEALMRARTAPPDLVILDLGLPGTNGLDVTRALRRAGDVPIIMLTARDDETDKLIGLELGADDYVTKPFSPREVVARVRAVLRRAGATPGREAASAATVLEFAGLRIDESRHEVLLEGRPVDLSALEFSLLVALAGAPGRVYSRAQLLERVWGYDFYGDERVVDVHIRGLRKALHDDATSPRVIGTVRGVGYKFLLASREDRR
ncbi:MAG: response regulator transcription factor, partial [Nocardioides sp.]|nr:response regulator transcription factor [Nocardioides sp.]